MFNASTADAAWRKVASALTEKTIPSQQSRSGPIREILHAAITVSEPTQRWVYSRNPVISLPFALAEIIWILSGRNDSAFLNYFNSELPRFAGFGKKYHGAYGYRLRRQFGIDQLERAFLALKNNSMSRQVVLQIWDTRSDMPDRSGKEVSEDIPCNICSSLKVRDGKLYWMQMMRSNDVFRGLPYNLVQFTSLQEIISGWLGVELGGYTHIVDSLHVYESDLETLNSRALRRPKNQDSLALPRGASLRAFKVLEGLVDAIIMGSTKISVIYKLAKGLGLPIPYKNIAKVLCAESARRRGSIEIAKEIMESCTNELYQVLFGEWLSRWQARG